MWSSMKSGETGQLEPDRPARDMLLIARIRMKAALDLLDAYSVSAASASLDMAIHHLDRELSAPQGGLDDDID